MTGDDFHNDLSAESVQAVARHALVGERVFVPIFIASSGRPIGALLVNPTAFANHSVGMRFEVRAHADDPMPFEFAVFQVAAGGGWYKALRTAHSPAQLSRIPDFIGEEYFGSVPGGDAVMESPARPSAPSPIALDKLVRAQSALGRWKRLAQLTEKNSPIWGDGAERRYLDYVNAEMRLYERILINLGYERPTRESIAAMPRSSFRPVGEVARDVLESTRRAMDQRAGGRVTGVETGPPLESYMRRPGDI